jgi:hypothetical protein
MTVVPATAEQQEDDQHPENKPHLHSPSEKVAVTGGVSLQRRARYLRFRRRMATRPVM